VKGRRAHAALGRSGKMGGREGSRPPAPRTVSPGLAAAPLTVAVVGDDGVGPGALLGLDVQHPVYRLLGLGQRLLSEAGQL